MLEYSEKLLDWVEANYTRNRALERLAGELYLSPTYLSHLFHQETGSTLSDSITARRMKQGCILLRTTTMPIREIGKGIGYSSAAYFCRVFKSRVGMTPDQYRKAHRLERSVPNN